jgi:hypothetical protein
MRDCSVGQIVAALLRRPLQAQSGTVIPSHLFLDMVTATVHTTFGEEEAKPSVSLDLQLSCGLG